MEPSLSRFSPLIRAVAVCAAWPVAPALLADATPSGAWTLVHIPDTQNYVASPTLAGIVDSQTQWIADQSAGRRIRFAVQVGDLVDNNSATQWARIKGSFDRLNGTVPYALCTGNHDCGVGGDGETRATLFTDPIYFGVGSAYEMQPTFKSFPTLSGESGNTQNSWHAFRVGKVDYLVLTAEWGPRDSAVAWMGNILASHPNHRAIIVVHAYMETATQRFDWSQSKDSMNPKSILTTGTINDGEDIWQKLASHYQNVCLVCCGHTTTGYLMSVGEHGQKVHQSVFDTQNRPSGGEGWLRLIEFWPDDRTVSVQTYTPFLNSWDETAAGRFSFTLSPVSTADSDGDGLPDYYEARHSITGAADDPDGDGASNLEEYIARTDPRSALSRFRVTDIDPAGPSVAWESVPGVNYRVEASAALETGGWTSLGEKKATASVTRFAVGTAGARRFFRIVALPE